MTKKHLMKGRRAGMMLILTGALCACASPVKSPQGTEAQNANAPVFTPAQEARIAALVRSTLVNNPQILADTQSSLAQQQTEREQAFFRGAVLKNLSLILDSTSSPALGSTHPDTLVIEFVDYQNSRCLEYYPVIKSFISSYPGVRFIFKQYPTQKSSIYPARMALAASSQGKFEAYNDAIFGMEQTGGQLTQQDVDAAATKAGVNLSLARAFMNSDSFNQGLIQDNRLAGNLVIQSTPSFIVMPAKPPIDPNKITVLTGLVGPGQLEQAIYKSEGVKNG